MRFMMIIKAPAWAYRAAAERSELAAMSRYNEALRRSGVLLEVSGLAAPEDGACVRFSGSQRTVLDGPRSEASELIAGYWLIQVRTKEEALEWAKRLPLGTEVHRAYEVEVELRRIVEPGELPREPSD